MTGRRTGRPRDRLSGAHVAFLSGEPHTPGHRYRVLDYAAAAKRLGWTTAVVTLDDAYQRLAAFAEVNLVVIWRAPWSQSVEAVVGAARLGGATVVFDIDDLVFEPDLATFEAIDGLRSQHADPDKVRKLFAAFERTMLQADIFTAPTAWLVDRMGRRGKPGLVLPNGFDPDFLQRSRRARLAQAAEPPDGLVRIGYAAGTITHQRDFAQAAGALAEVLATRPDHRLVLFKAGDVELVQLGEFPELQALSNQIEWRQMRPLDELPDELARFDISIAPLHWGTPFCEAKSELKFFEAALVGVPTIASPTATFRQAIDHGRNGLLAEGPSDWKAALDRLLDSKALRAELARAAHRDSLRRHGARGRRLAFAELAALALPAEPPLLATGSLRAGGEALQAPRVSLIVPVFNVAPFLDECLASLSAQSFAEIEIIAVNDASTDASASILHRWASRDGRIHIVHQDHRGLSATRNAGLDLARGEFVCFVDSDDIAHPDYVAELLAAAVRTESPMACCAIEYLAPDGSTSFHSTFHATSRVAPYMRDEVIDFTDKRLLVEMFPSAWNKIYLRSLFDDVRYPEGLNYEDHLVFFSIGLAIDRCAYVAAPLYRQRLGRPGAITADDGERNFDIFPILRRLFAALQTKPEPWTAPLFKQLALRLCWERANCLTDLRRYEAFCIEAHALLEQTETLGCVPLADDAWIPSAFARRVQLDRPPAAPFCSVVLTYTDDEAFLGDMLDQLSSQTLRDIEIILVDNGSSDGAAAIAAAHCVKDQRLRGLQHGKGAPGGARNLGLGEARGDYVVFFEANDLARPDTLERLYSYAEDVGADVVVCGFDYVQPQSVSYHTGVHRRLEQVEQGSAPAKFVVAETGTALAADFLALPCNKLFRRGFLTDAGLRFEVDGFFEEHAFWLDVARAGPRVFYTSEPLYRIREEEAARRVWRSPSLAGDALGAIAHLQRRLAAPDEQGLFARLSVRLAWERLSFALVSPSARRAFAAQWRELTAHIDDATLIAQRDEYISAEIVEHLLALARPRPTPAPVRRAILVAGMHRSGTSAVARVLNLLGAKLPSNLLGAGLGNDLGHWEPRSLIELHSQMLSASAEANWDGLLGPRQVWFESSEAGRFVDRVEAFIDSEFANEPLWVVKDPRIALLTPIWRRALERVGVTCHFVLPYRHPVEVARSLERREREANPDKDWTLGRGTLLWLRYVLSAERDTRGCSRSFVRFERLVDDWRRETQRLGMQLGLTWPRSTSDTEREIDDFLKADHRHERWEEPAMSPTAVSPLLLEVLDQLDRCVDEPDAGAAVFDCAFQVLQTSDELYAGVVAPLEQKARDLGRLRAEGAARESGLRAEIDALSRRVEELDLALADTSLRHEHVSAALTAASAQVQHLNAALALSMATAADAAEAAQNDLNAQAARLQLQLSQLTEAEHKIVAGQRETLNLRRTLDQAHASHRAQLSAIGERSNRLEWELQAVTRSTSWKLTAPLRKLRRRLARP